MLYGAFSTGYILGELWLGRYARLRRRGLIVYGATIMAGLGMLALGLPIGITAAVLAAVIYGAGLELFGLVWASALQELVPNDLLGSGGATTVAIAALGLTHPAIRALD